MTPDNRQLAAIMFTDIVGYTTLMGRDEEKGLALLRKNREIHKPLIEKHHGKWIKEMGDGMLVQFDSAYNAALCAIDIQQTARKYFKGQLRIGLHIGDIIIENDDIFGDGVNIASRIESLADPSGIYLSESMHMALHNHTDIQTHYLGEVSLKNVDEAVRIYCVVGEDLYIPPPYKIRQLKSSVENETSTGKKFFSRPIFYVLLSILLVSLFAIQYWHTVKPPRVVEAMAVLPFTNLTGNDDEQYFVDMMHDAVIGELSKISDLIVKSRTSTLQFRDTELTIPEIAKKLNVDAIIESSVYKTGDSVLLQVQLIQARPEEDHIWSQEFERDTKHILSLYGELAKTIAKDVEIQLTPQEEIRLTHKKEVNPEAYKAYAQGQFHWNKLSKENFDIAENYFNLAKEIDPDYALAYVGLVSVALGRSQMGLIPFHESALNSIKFLNKALKLDSTLSEVHFLVATFNTWGLWDFEKAEIEFRKAIEYNPNFAKARIYYSHLLCILHDYKEAARQCDIALNLDPYNNLSKGIIGMTLNFSKKYDEAISILNEIREFDYYNGIALSTLRTSYHMQGNYQKALEIWRDSYRKDSLAISVLEKGFLIGGYSEALKNLAELLIVRSQTQFVTPWRICTIYTRAGMKEEALEWMDKAYIAHDQNIPYIITDPIFDFMRDDPRFQVIVKKMKFPD